MAPLTLEAAYRALKGGELVPVYYLTGDDDILKDDLVAALVNAAVDPAARDFNLDVRSAADLDGESLSNLVETPPMLAERRAVVVKGIEQWRAGASVWKVLARYLARPSPATMLVLVQSSGEKTNAATAAAARHIQVDGLKPEQAIRWAVDRAKRAGVTLDPKAAAHLIAAVGADLGHVAMEIEKLAAASPADAPVTVDDVARMVGIRSGETLPDWVGAALARDIVRGVRLLAVVLPQTGVNGVRMVMALGTAMTGTRFARSLLDGGSSPGAAEGAILRHLQAARPPQIGVWKDEAHRWVTAAGRWTAAELDEALRALQQADRSLKTTGVTEEEGILTSLLLRFAPTRAAA